MRETQAAQSITTIKTKALHTHGLGVVKPRVQKHQRHAAAMQVPHPGVCQAALVGWVADLGEVDARDATAARAAAPCPHQHDSILTRQEFVAMESSLIKALPNMMSK